MGDQQTESVPLANVAAQNVKDDENKMKTVATFLSMMNVALGTGKEYDKIVAEKEQALADASRREAELKARLEESKQAHETELKRLHEQHEREKKEVDNDYTMALAQLRDEHLREKKEVDCDFKLTLARIREEHQQEKEKWDKVYESKLKEERAVARAQRTAAKARYDEERKTDAETKRKIQTALMEQLWHENLHLKTSALDLERPKYKRRNSKGQPCSCTGSHNHWCEDK